MNTNFLFFSLSIVFYAQANFNQAQTQLHNAILKDSVHEIQRAITTGAVQNNTDDSTEWLLTKAILHGNTSAIKQMGNRLISEGKNCNAPIVWAALLKKPNAVKTLLECDARIDANLIKYTIKAGDFNSALAIIKSGIDITDIMQECMELTVFTKNANFTLVTQFILELVDRGYNVNNILHLDASYCAFDGKLLEFLLSKGANPNIVMTQNGLSGATPLMIAVHHQNKKAVKTLLNAGARINQPAKFRKNYSSSITPLHAAVTYNIVDSKMVELLMEHGAQY